MPANRTSFLSLSLVGVATIVAIACACQLAQAAPDSQAHAGVGENYPEQSYFINQPQQGEQADVPVKPTSGHGERRPYKERVGNLVNTLHKEAIAAKTRVLASPRVQELHAKVAPKVQHFTSAAVDGLGKGASKVVDKVNQYREKQAQKQQQNPGVSLGASQPLPRGPPMPARPANMQNSRPAVGDEYDISSR